MRPARKKNCFSLILSLFIVLLPLFAAFASGGEGGHDSSQWKGLAFKTFNAAIIIGALVWFLAPKIKSFFSGRRQEIKESLESAAAQKAEAEKQYREYSEKIDKASQEIDGIFEMIKAQGVVEKEKIIEDARKVAAKMKEDAQARIEQELSKASTQLRNEAVVLSVQMAEEILKKSITAQDHEAMIREYVDKVVSKKLISNIAKRYARAFFELAEEENKLEQYYNELNLFSSIMKQNKDLNGFLVNPIFEQEDKKRVLEQVISKLSLSPMTINFLKLLIDKKRIDALADIESCYRQQMDEVLKKLRATVKTAFPLSEEMLAYVTSGLEKMTGKQVEVTVETDESLLGGIMIGLGDTLYDGSIKSQLNNMRNLLGEAR